MVVWVIVRVARGLKERYGQVTSNDGVVHRTPEEICKACVDDNIIPTSWEQRIRGELRRGTEQGPRDAERVLRDIQQTKT